MLRACHVALSLPLVLFSTIQSLGADSPAISSLKEKGLTRSGRFFVIEAENSVLEKWKDARAIITDYAATARRKSEAEMAANELSQLEERRSAIQEKLTQINQQINEQGFQQGGNRPGGFGQGAYLSQLIAQRNMLSMALAETVSTQKAGADGATDTKSLEAESHKRLETAAAVLTELRKSVGAVTKQYDKLNLDSDVISALHALENEKIGVFKLGPSPAFKSTVKAIENAERIVLARKAPGAARKKGRLKR